MNRDKEESGFKETLELLREAHREAIPEAHFAAVRARVFSQLAAERRPWWRGAWPYGFAMAVVAAMLLAAFVGRTPGSIRWSARVPLDPPFGRGHQPQAIHERPTRASAADQRINPGVRPTLNAAQSVVGRRKRLPHNAAPAAYRVVGPPALPHLLVKLVTNDPNVVIYWITGE
jgi:hypothetical protein